VKDENGSIVCFLLLLYLLEHKKPGGENHEKQWKQNQKSQASVKNNHKKKLSEHTRSQVENTHDKNWNVL